MKRVLVVTTIDRTVQAFLEPFISQMKSLGLGVDVATNFRDDASRSQIGAICDATHHIAFSRSPTNLKQNLVSVRDLRRILINERYDVLHLHTPVAAAITRIATRSGEDGPHVVYVAHGFHFFEDSRRTSLVWQLAERLLRRRTDTLVVINDEDMASAVTKLRYSPSDVVKLQGVGIDLDAYAPAPVPHARDMTIALIGHLDPGKRPFLALQAFALLPDSARLLVAGDGPLLRDATLLAEDLGVSNRVDFLGFTDVRAVLNRSSALLFPSEREGLPRAVLEAVACGVPVVAFPIRGVVDIVGRRAWHFPPTDLSPSAVAIALQSACDYDPPVAEMRRSLAGFTLQSVLADHERLLDRVLRDV